MEGNAATGRSTRWPPRWRRGAGALAVGAALGLVAVGCSSAGSDARTATTRPGGSPSGKGTTAGAGAGADRATTSSAPPAVADEYVGPVDAFYRVPDPLPKGAPGDLIRVQQVAGGGGSATLRVMYHSTDATGADRAVTGIISYPTGPAPKGGWPVISTAHGTTGIASPCAPSRRGAPYPQWGIGHVVDATTDYIGLGPIGERHAYLSKVDEGNSVIDIVRAARNIPQAHASDRWVAIGHSQGGHGALAAHELAAERAPELHLVATVALAPAALLDQVYGGIDPIVTAILTMMGLYGAQDEHPDVDLADYLSPEAMAKANVFDTGCLDQITDAMVGVAMRGAFRADPRQTEPVRSMLLAQDVGTEAVDGVPLLLASGTKDDRVVIDRFLATARRICATGQVAEVHVVPGATHDSVIGAEASDVRRFVADALAGRPATDSCRQPEAAWTDAAPGT
ncbi:MAG: lipase family protein [Acidimicrobiales bacterium]